MKLNNEGLFKHLSTKLASLYLIEGDEPLLVEESLDALHAALKTQGFTERLTLTIDAQFKRADLDGLTENFSLFAEKKRIQLNCSEKIPAELSAWMLDYCAHLQNYADLCVIVKTPKLSGPEKKAKWVTALEKAGVLVTIYAVALQDYPRWLDARLFREKLKLTPEARMALIEQTEGNLLAAAQIIKKLALFQRDHALTIEDITPLLSENARYDLFDLSRQVLLGDIKRALRIFAHLKRDMEPVLVLWVLAKELKTLLTLRLKKNTLPQAELYRSLQIWDKRIQEVETALRRLPEPTLARLFAFCAEIDLACKGLKEDDPWDMLKDLVVKMARSAPHSSTIQDIKRVLT